MLAIRFQSGSGNSPLGPQGEEAKKLAYPDGHFADEIEFDGRTWRFHHTELLKDDESGPEPSVTRLVYVEPPIV